MVYRIRILNAADNFPIVLNMMARTLAHSRPILKGESEIFEFV